jgi:RND family efflux transporter MFP subunit
MNVSDMDPSGAGASDMAMTARRQGITVAHHRCPAAIGAFGGLLVLLAGCGEENRFVAPPPPKVTVARPLQQPFTPYLEATGNTAAVNTVKLVARVQGYVQEIKYKDGQTVKKGTPLFVIEPEPYKVKLEQAQAAEEGAKAALLNAEAEFQRQKELQAKEVSTQANYDRALANRDTSRANLLQAQANSQTAEINLGYTQITAPFDGVVTARKVSVGELVGGDQTSELASIVQLDPIWVWFNVSERDVQRVRADMAARGVTPGDLGKVEVEVGLQTENGYPHKGILDYADPGVSQSTGTLLVRGVLQNPAHALLPGYFVRVRVPLRAVPAVLVPDVAVGSDQGGRYVLVVNADNVVEQRRVELGQSNGTLRVIEQGLSGEERVVVAGILEAVPGQKVDPQLQPRATGTAASAQPPAR